jgi:hypothetical protein
VENQVCRSLLDIHNQDVNPLLVPPLASCGVNFYTLAAFSEINREDFSLFSESSGNLNRLHGILLCDFPGSFPGQG